MCKPSSSIFRSLSRCALGTNARTSTANLLRRFRLPPASSSVSIALDRHLGGQQQQLRSYRGEARDGVRAMSDEEEALLKIALPRSEEIFRDHVTMPDLDKIPASSFDRGRGSGDPSGDEVLKLEVRRKRLVYRSKQRGWLEVDLLLGTWASENVSKLSGDELDQYEDFCNLETIDIYNIITLKVDIPEELRTPKGDGVVERIQEWARSSPLGRADPSKYRQAKIDANLI